MNSLPLLAQLLCLLLFHSASSLFPNSSSSSSQVLCPYDQRHALLQFRSSFSINTSASSNYSEYGVFAYPKTESWKEGTDCCSWNGVTCDSETSYVIGLDLSSSMLYGTFHSHNNSLFLLSHLQKLDLSNNYFLGSNISSQFGQLLHLTHINLSFTSFEGHVPSELSHLSNLVSLDLSQNYDLKLDSSSFSNIIQNLTMLKEFDLSYVNMSPVAPTSFMNLSSSLTSLRLQDCKLQGKVPNNIHLPELVSLDLSWNDNLAIDQMALHNLREVNLNDVNLSLMAPSSLMNLSSSLSSLHLEDCGLQGEFPGNLLQRPNLQLLDLWGNDNLIGFLPRSNWSSSLQLLDVSWTKILINLEPDFINNLRSIKGLYVAGCNFIGSNLAVFSNLTQLTILDFSYNNFNGQIPPSLGKLQYLTYLDLSYNNFNGEIPPSFGNLHQLTHLFLSSNSLSGDIPSSFTNLKQLTSVDLSNNSLSGPLPTYFSNFTKLSNLDLSNNRLIGSIPSEVGRLSNLFNLDLSNNFFNATLPSSLFALPQLERLDLKNNQFSGPIGQFQSKSLSYIDLSYNNLHGSIPSSILNHKRLQVLILSSNQKLNGGLSSSICKLNSLQILDLSDNSLTGFIPQCLGNFSNSLLVLHLGVNNFWGIIPAMFSKGSGLRYLNFNGNQLQGEIPSSVVNCRNLEILDLGSNEIDDVFPNFLGDLPNLQILVLKSNKLHGSLKGHNANFSFPKLRIFDLSNNTFSGHLPVEYFNNFQAMMDLTQDFMYMRIENYSYSVDITLKGLDIKLVKIQISLSIIDLSLNKFIGEIPGSIGKLKSLKLLNLSHNYLTGNIQPSLGNLTSLESLDLSSNLLTGIIPMQLMNLIFLEIFRVSHNQLEGPIPRGKQFNTFGSDSYEGNLGLCGFPLSKECKDDSKQDVEPSNIQEEDDLEFINGFGWNAAITGCGCGLALGVSLGYAVFTNKPNWFVNKVEGAWNKRLQTSRKKLKRLINSMDVFKGKMTIGENQLSSNGMTDTNQVSSNS